MPDFAMRRTMMVDTQVRPSDVTKFPIIDAMLRTPREVFVPAEKREAAYIGENLVLTDDAADPRVLLDPRSFAKMLDALNLGSSDLVLDIGCASGYSSAVLARIVQGVVAVEQDKALCAEAQAALAQVGADMVVLHEGPLAEGAAENAPYDAMILQGGIETFPQALTDQLREDGRVVALFMEGALGVVRLGLKQGNHIAWRDIFNATAPVLPGFERAASFTF